VPPQRSSSGRRELRPTYGVVNKNTMGGDPAQGQYKKLVLTYQYQGRVDNVAVGENGRLNVP